MKVTVFVCVGVLLSVQLLLASPGYSQDYDNKIISLNYADASIKTIFRAIEKRADVVIMYLATDQIKKETASIFVQNKTVAEVLDQLLRPEGLVWDIRGNVIRIGRAQTVTLSGKDLPLKQVFSAIKKQTGFLVFANQSLLADTKPVTLAVADMPLEEFLAVVLRDQPLAFRVTDKTIVLSRKPAPPAPFVVVSSDQPPLPLRGRILSPDGSPLPGITVSLNKNAPVVISDAEGMFSLPVSEGDLLVFTGVGFEKKELRITRSLLEQSKTAGFVLPITLSLSYNPLDEAIVIGYGTTTRRNNTGSSVTVKGEDIMSTPTSNFANALQGRVAGVQITQGNGLPGSPMPGLFNSN